MSLLNILEYFSIGLLVLSVTYNSFKFVLNEVPFKEKFFPFLITLSLSFIGILIIKNADVISITIAPYLGEMNFNPYIYLIIVVLYLFYLMTINSKDMKKTM